ncbi:MAG: autotransporter-associated beta strand repeat-containing protein, partial [Burkholderiales bacterium]|nr:autotransporter-associated beta strand repeat-containing protein [Phycisphaerae bacterium]
MAEFKTRSFRKFSNRDRVIGAAACLVAAGLVGPLAPRSAQAANLTWDILAGDGATITDGTGTWTEGLGNWNNAGADANWAGANPDSAIIGSGGTAGIITLGGPILIGNMTINATTGNYTIDDAAVVGNFLKFNNNAVLTLNAAGTTTINAAVTSVAANNTLTLAGAGNVLFSSSIGLVAGGAATALVMGPSFSGTATLGGAIDNGGMTLTSNGGTILLDKTVGTARAVGGISTINAGLVRITGTGGDQFYDGGSGGTVTLNGGTLDLFGHAETINALGGTGASGIIDNTDAAAATLTIGAQNVSGVFGGSIRNTGAGTLSIVKTGTGVQTLLGTASTYSGTTQLDNGALAIKAGGSLGTSSLLFNGGTLRVIGAGTHDFTTRAIAVNSGKTLLMDQLSGVTVTLGGLSSIGNGLTKTGGGNLNLVGNNTFTGATSLNGGTTTLDYAAGGTRVSGVSLLLGGATLNLAGGTAANNETPLDTTFNSGHTTINQTGGGTSTIALGAITRNPGATLGIAPNIASTTSGTASTILADAAGTAYGVVNGNDWAAKDAGNANIVGLSTVGTYTPDAWAPGNHTDVTISSAPASGSTTGSLRFNTAAANVVTLAGANTITTGGVLVTSNVGNNLSTITGGSVTGAGNEVVVVQNNTANGLTINTAIINNAGNATSFTKSGAGLFTLRGANTYTGQNYLNGGVTNADTDARLGVAPISVTTSATNSPNVVLTSATLPAGFAVGSGLLGRTVIAIAGTAVTLSGNANAATAVATNRDFGGQLNINGGTLQFNTNFTTGRGVVLGSNGGTIDTQNVGPTVAGVISGPGSLTKVGINTLNLSGPNTFSGGVTITAGTISVGANTTVFGSGPLTLASTTANSTTLNISNQNFTTGLNNLIVQTGTSNRINYSNNSTLPFNGTITGGGTLQLGSGFNPTFGFHGDVTAFTGTLQFSGNSATGGANTNYDFTNPVAVGAPNATVKLDSGSLSTNATNVVNMRWNPASAVSAVIPIGSLSGSFALGQSATNITIQNARAATTATFQIGGLNTNTAFPGIIQNGAGTVAITKVGTGTLSLSGANSYTGATTANAGQLNVSGAHSNGTTGNYAINNTGTLNLTGSLGGSAPVSVNGGGTLLGGGNGSTTGVISGPVAVAGGSTAPTQGTISMLDGANLTFAFNAGLTLGGLSGNPSVLKFDADGTSSDLFTIAGADAFIVNPGGARISIADGGLSASTTYTLATYSNTVAPSNILFDNGSLTKAFGLSTATLNISATAITMSVAGTAAANTMYWTGSAGSAWNGISGSNVSFSTDAAGTINAGAIPSTNTDVIFTATGAGNLATTLGQNFSIKGLVFNNPAAVSISGGNQLTLGVNGINVAPSTGAVTLDNTTVVLGANQVWTNDAASPLTVSSNITGSAALTIAGTGAINLGGPGFTSGDLTVNGNLDVKGTSITAGTLGGTGSITNTGTTNATLNTTVAADSTYSGTLADGGAGKTLSLIKGGAAILTLSGNNSHSGTNSVNSGTLKLGSSTALGTGSVSVATGATLDLNGSTIANSITAIAGDGVSTTGVLANTSATAAAITSPMAASGNFSVDTTGNITLSTVTSGVNRNLTKNGNGTLSLIPAAGVSNNLAVLTINAGTVVLGASGTAQSVQGVIVNNGVLKSDPLYVTNPGAIWQGQVNNEVTLNGG